MRWTPLLVLPLALAQAQELPATLLSPLIAQKVLQVATEYAPRDHSSFPTTFPQYTSRDNGAWFYFKPDTWTSSFFPSLLHLLDQRDTICPNATGAPQGTDWRDLENRWSTFMITNTQLTTTHDVGFLSWVFQDQYSLHNDTAKQYVLDMANNLAARFNPVVGCTKSWDKGAGDFQVIIDNMMNLELLLLASDITGNQTYYDMAISHANKTMANHIREDGSTFHVVDYDPTNGKVGFSNDSTWSRGQAWGIYGYTSMYDWTSFFPYLATARSLGLWYLSHLPEDGVPYWDFSQTTNKDSSSATIAASAFLLLSSMELRNDPQNITGASFWRQAAVDLITATSQLAWNEGWSSLLANGTVNNRANPPNNNTGTIYGDYYFIEAGNRFLQLGMLNCTDGSIADGADANRTSLPSTQSKTNPPPANSSLLEPGNGAPATNGTSEPSGSNGGGGSDASALKANLGSIAFVLMLGTGVLFWP
ncbi:glycoside hydrolase family 88 protein [Atractiella rhizophila]|nr:glycoside hydrolase family 88 protein [Atractiella rhizophila]